MTVVVTGHRGYVGCVLTAMLVERGHDVLGIDTDLYAGSTFGDEPRLPDVQWHRRDVRDLSASDLAGADAVIHLAGLSNDPLGDLDPQLTDEINHRATVRLGELAREAGVARFVFASSCSNYGAAGDDWLDEDSPLNPVTPYGRSKVDAEVGLTALADQAFSPTFLRSATAFGPSPRLRFDLVVNNLVAWAVCTGEVRLKSTGESLRPLVHVADMAAAFVSMIEAPRERVHLQTFNVGSTEANHRIVDIAHAVAAAVPGSRVVFADDAEPDRRNYRVNCDRITHLGYRTRHSMHSTIDELRDLYVAADLEIDDVEGPRYRRVDRLRTLIDSGQVASDLRWTGPPSERHSA